MAGKFTHVGAGFALDATLGRATVTLRTVYLRLLTAAPTAATTLATMTEYGGTGYTGQAMAVAVPAGTPRTTSNTAGLTFGPITAGAGAAINNWIVGSAATGTSGDALVYGDWTTARTPNVGDSLTVAIGDVDITLD